MKSRLIKFTALVSAILMVFSICPVPVAAETVDMFWGFEDPDLYLDVPDLKLQYNGFMHDGTGDAEIQSAVKYSGEYAMRTNTADLVWGMVWGFKPTKGREYSFSVMIKSDGLVNPRDFTMYARISYPVVVYLADSVLIEEGTYDWTKYELTFTAVSDAMVELGIQPFLTAPGMEGTLYIDDLHVVDLDPDPTESPASSAPASSVPASSATVSSAPASSQTASQASDVQPSEVVSEDVSEDGSNDVSSEEVSFAESDEVSESTESTDVSDELSSEAASSADDPEEGSKTWLWIVIAAVAVASAAVAVVIVKKKKG